MMKTLYSVHRIRADGTYQLIRAAASKDEAVLDARNSAGDRFWENGVLVLEQPVGRMMLPTEKEIHDLIQFKQALEQAGIFTNEVRVNLPVVDEEFLSRIREAQIHRGAVLSPEISNEDLVEWWRLLRKYMALIIVSEGMDYIDWIEGRKEMTNKINFSQNEIEALRHISKEVRVSLGLG